MAISKIKMFSFLFMVNLLVVRARESSTRIVDRKIKPYCNAGFIHCDFYKCIPMKLKCDGHYDCLDKTDEPNTCPPHHCTQDEFRCRSGRCLAKYLWCNKEEAECGEMPDGTPDNSDEENCHYKITCPPNEYHCLTAHKCIHLSMFCNGHIDCPDGSDEHSRCAEIVDNGSCQYGYGMTYPDGALCYCPKDQIPHGSTCIPENKCERRFRGEQPVCSQECLYKEDGNYECSCTSGYKAVNSSCIPIDNTGNIIVTTNIGWIVSPSLEWNSLNEAVSSNSNQKRLLKAFAADSNRNRLCYVVATGVKWERTFLECAEITDVNGNIMKTNVTASYELNQVTKMQYDWVGDNWVFLLADLRVIICRNHEVQMNLCKTLVEIPNIFIQEITVDGTFGYLFYSTMHTFSSQPAGLWRVNLDGRNAIRILDSGSTMPFGIALDTHMKTLYLLDRFLGNIHAVDYEKQYPTRRIIHDKMLTSVSNMAFFGGHLYLVSGRQLTILDVVKPYIRDAIHHEFKEQINHIIINHKLQQVRGSHPCAIKNGGCSDLCVAEAGNTLPICLCAEGLSLINNRCIEGGAHDSLLVFSHTGISGILGIQLPISANIEALKVVPYMRAVLNIGSSGSFTINGAGKEIIMWNSLIQSIIKRGLHENDIMEIFHDRSGKMDCTGLAYDQTAGNLYYTDGGTKSIGVFKFHPLLVRRILINENLLNPRAIVLNQDKGFMFWADKLPRGRTQANIVKRSGAKIERSRMDGSERTILVISKIHWPESLAIDSGSNWLYWCDSFYDVIERIDFTGDNRMVIVSAFNSISHSPFSIAIIDKYVFWSDNKGIKRAMLRNNLNATDVQSVLLDSVGYSRIEIYDENIYQATSKCSIDNGGCFQFCFPMSCEGTGCKAVLCGCADGFFADGNDETRCIANRSFVDSAACNSSLEFSCLSGECVDRHKLCDGRRDCEDASDEDVKGICANVTCKANEFRCDDTLCLSLHLLCDGRIECIDGTDESEEHCKDQSPRCRQNYVRCISSKECIPNEWKCDGRTDCADASDEKDCERPSCRYNEFMCNSGKCIPLQQVCDGVPNCRDRSDEEHCEEGCLKGRQFRCEPDAACLDLHFKCDGVVDCRNRMDEEKCGNSSASYHKVCKGNNQFPCLDGKCIRKTYVCDGASDCSSGEDEMDCSAIHVSCNLTSSFLCVDGSKCIPQFLECDGYNDCVDNSDEHEHCGYDISRSRAVQRCIEPSFLCSDGPPHCLPPTKVCDGKADCRNKDDEGAFCHDNTCEGMCEQICSLRPDGSGYTCACHTGYILMNDGRSCEKGDPCSFGNCSQYCIPHGHNRHCYCDIGFEMSLDGFSCIAVDVQRPFILFTDRVNINQINDELLPSRPVLSDLHNAVAFDYLYHIEDKISLFWTDVDLGVIQTAELKGGVLSKPRTIYRATAEGLAVDWITSNVYWVDSNFDDIEVISLDGSMHATVVSGDMVNPRALALDPSSGYMFWTDWEGAHPRIERATLSGNGRKILYKFRGVGDSPLGLTCDIVARRIYWVDVDRRWYSIHTITYEGRDHVEVVGKYVLDPLSIDIFENYIYWTDRWHKHIGRCNKWNGTQINTIEKTSTRPLCIKVVHRSKQPRMSKNPCDSKPCSHLCVMDTPTNFTCLCPHFTRYTNKSDIYRGCEDVKVALLLGSTHIVRAVDIYPPHRMLFPHFRHGGIITIRGLVADSSSVFVLSDTGRGIWPDIGLKKKGSIYQIYANSLGSGRMIIDLELENCDGLAMDRISGVLYFSSWSVDGRATIAVSNISGTHMSVIMDSDSSPLRKPRDLVMLEDTVTLVWFDDGYQPTAIFTARGDGSEIKRVAQDAKADLLFCSSYPTYDVKRKYLFWLTKDNRTIASMDIRTWKITSFMYASDDNLRPTSMLVDEFGDIFVMEDGTNSIVHTRFRSNSVNDGFLKEPISRTVITHLDNRYMAIMNRTLTATCGDPTCHHLCLRVSMSKSICRCPEGFKYEDGNCIGPPKFVLFATKDGKVYSVAINADWKQSQPAHSLPATSSDFLDTPLDIAVDIKRDLMFFVVNNKVWMISRNGTIRTELLLGAPNQITSLAVDYNSGSLLVGLRIPYGSNDSGVIQLLDPHRRQDDIRVTLLKDEEMYPSSIRLDSIKGLIFWISKNCIKKATYDGLTVTCLVNKTVETMVIDRKANRICYMRKQIFTLYCLRYDGSNKQVAATFSIGKLGMERIAIDISGDNLYFFQRSKTLGEIVVGERRRNGTFEITRSIDKPKGLHTLDVRVLVVYDKADLKYENGCSHNNGGCEHLCFSSGVSVRCICAHSELTSNGSCIAYSAFVAFAVSQSEIQFASMLPFNTARSSPFKSIEDKNITKNVKAMVSDSDRHQLFVSDLSKFRIVAINYDRQEYYAVCEDVGKVYGLSLDPMRRELYFTRVNPPSIWRVSVRNREISSYPIIPTRVTLLGENSPPQAIAVHSCKMLLFFSVFLNGKSSIERMYYSGFRRERIIESINGEVSSIAIDFISEKIYFTDKFKSISRVDLDGRKKEVVLLAERNTRKPISVAVHKDDLFYTDERSRNLIAVDKVTGLGERVLSSSQKGGNMPGSIAIFSPELAKCGMDACSSSIIECEDLCRMAADGTPHCDCYEGRKLERDKKTCIERDYDGICAENEFMCIIDGHCIHYERTCDGIQDCPHGDDEEIAFCSARTCRSGYFSCGSGVCIPMSKKCDRYSDCANQADEIDCNCREDEFKCSYGLCIPISSKCDYKLDCYDASDEQRDKCPPRDCSLLEEGGLTNLINCTRTTRCIRPEWRCDGEDNCWDDSDEEGCSEIIRTFEARPVWRCNENDGGFTCRDSGYCIPQGRVCDGQSDCADDSDEENCEHRCSENFEFTCVKSGGICIPIDHQCDGRIDCLQGEDEANCKDHCVEKDSFRCASNRCIPRVAICDGHNDCMDGGSGTDETNCSATSIIRDVCKDGEFECKVIGKLGVSCVPLLLMCNGEKDCEDGSDEDDGCDLPNRCTFSSDLFQCLSGQCILSEWRCNGIKDCFDGSDEISAACSNFECPPSKLDYVRCVVGDGPDDFTCIPQKDICNGTITCYNLPELEVRCHVNECSLQKPCDEICEDLPYGFRCSCRPPKELDMIGKLKCLYVDMCPTANCSHFCWEKTSGHYECTCDTGYQLVSDRHGCKRDDSYSDAAELLLISRHELKLFSVDGHSGKTLLTNLTNGVAVDFDIRENAVYWTDIGSPYHSNKFGMVSLTGQHGSWMTLSGLTSRSPDGIAVDWLGRNIYWTDMEDKSISIADLRGRYHQTLLRGGKLRNPRAIVIDPLLGFVFWSDWENPPYIGRMGLDGLDIHIIVNSSLWWPNALTIDTPAKRIYWGDAFLDYIGSCDYDGSHRRNVLRRAAHHIFSLAVFEDYLYWTDWHDRTVVRAHKITGEKKKTIIHNMVHPPMGIKVVHPLMQLMGSDKVSRHPCQTPMKCDNICLPANNKDGYKCICAKGFRSEGNKCVSDCKSYEMVCRKTYKCVPEWWRCDGQDDCGDGEDEGYFLGICREFTCKPGQMSCRVNSGHAMTKCLNTSSICDGIQNCPLNDDEDEELCRDYNCQLHQFKCSNKNKCIPKTALCDKKDDCGDFSDELGCSKHILECGADYFACHHPKIGVEKCIPLSSHCDGKVDCSDDQDEPENCDIRNCISTEFRCNNGKCIPGDRKCDGHIDCLDKSDEKRCAVKKNCSVTDFDCRQDDDSHQCIPLSWKCDGKKDCLNGFDELNCRNRAREFDRPCDERQFTCREDFVCLDRKRRCDGHIDCSDGSDEHLCANGCTKDQVACGDRSGCIETSYICDDVQNCDDMSDEMNCVVYQKDWFECIPNRYMTSKLKASTLQPLNWTQAIHMDRVCDGIVDCLNGRDERADLCRNHRCPAGYVKCNNGLCYPESGRCDGVNDCVDGSDEKDDICKSKCANGFRCLSGRCIVVDGRCNGIDDCGDNSDEDGCGITRCSRWGTCSQLCEDDKDGQNVICSCADGYEKSPSGTCKAIDPEKAEIVILDGNQMHVFRMDLDTDNIDAVSVVRTDITERIKMDFDYFYGFSRAGAVEETLDRSENFSVPKFFRTANSTMNSSSPLYWFAQLQDSKYLNIRFGTYEAMIKASSVHPLNEHMLDIDEIEKRKQQLWNVDPLANHHSWSARSKGIFEGKRRLDKERWEAEEKRIRFLADDAQWIKEKYLMNKYLAYDWWNGNLYETYFTMDAFSGNEEQHAIDLHTFTRPGYAPKERMTIVPYMGDITSLAVAPAARLLFWTSTRPQAAIYSASLGGSNRRIIISDHVYYPRSIIVDEPNSRIYWIDVVKFTIETSLLNGTDRRIVRKYPNSEGIDRPWSMDVFEDSLFVVGRPKGNFWRTSKFGNGREEEVFFPYLMSGSARSRVRVIHHAKRRVPVPSDTDDGFPCRTGNRGKLCHGRPCVPISSKDYINLTHEKVRSDAAYCLCATGRFFNESGNTCDYLDLLPDNVEKCQIHRGGLRTRKIHDYLVDVLCRNGGRCDRDRCVCPPGFGGEECQLDACESYCKNGGTCERLGASYVNGVSPSPIRCICTAEYIGDRCERHICDGVCGNHGSCRIEVDAKLHCDCDVGWTGKHCQTKVETCSGFCFNGGTCLIDRNDVPRCNSCPQFYAGLRCENCHTESGKLLACHQGGYCQSREKCICAPGWTGEYCLDDVCAGRCNFGMDCVHDTSLTSGVSCQCRKVAGSHNPDCLPICSQYPDWCSNKGICIDSSTGVGQCHCFPRFTGTNCNIQRSCEEYCLNGGSCIEINETHWRCICAYGFEGDQCSEYALCARECRNGGTCVPDSSGTGICLCPSGLGGDTCIDMVASVCAPAPNGLQCANEGYCEIVKSKPRCHCTLGWEGLCCMVPTCNHFCLNGGECLIINKRTECRCLHGYEGDRCQIILTAGGVMKVDHKRSHLVSFIMAFGFTSLVVASVCFVMILLLRHFYLTKRGQLSRGVVNPVFEDDTGASQAQALLGNIGTNDQEPYQDIEMENVSYLPAIESDNAPEHLQLPTEMENEQVQPEFEMQDVHLQLLQDKPTEMEG